MVETVPGAGPGGVALVVVRGPDRGLHRVLMDPGPDRVHRHTLARFRCLLDLGAIIPVCWVPAACVAPNS